MAMDDAAHEAISAFVERSRFTTSGCVMTDLDGTAVHEDAGRIAIPDEVARGMRAIRELGRPVALNSLRFPLSVIRTFGREWYAISNAPLPLVSLNGSLVGHLEQDKRDDIVFREDAAWPLEPSESETVWQVVERLISDGLDDIVLFLYPRDWTRGEHVWTPHEDRIPGLRSRYASATDVATSTLGNLRKRLAAEEHVMLMLLADIPQDRRMAYQHTSPTSVFTNAGTNKATGALRLAERLGVDLGASIGAGDTPMDTFLGEVGLAVHVGPIDLTFQGRHGTVRLPGSHAFGEMLFDIASRLSRRA